MMYANLLRQTRHCALAAIMSLAGMASAQNAPLVTVADGTLAGATQGAVNRFLGIPYAQPPVGDLRWVSPQPPAPWPGVRSATAFGPACPQEPTDPIADGKGSKEDCLTINVFAPNTQAERARPVIVFIHGGGYVLGSSRGYDATRMAEAMDAVVVTFNYRMGALGLLWTSGMAAAKQGSNFTLQDQQTALRWVQANIARFNGDPGNVTLSGHSVGGMSTSAHLVSPGAKGLFHKAIMLSGVMQHRLRSPKAAAVEGDAYAGRLGCPADAQQLACLRGKSIAEIMAVSQTYSDVSMEGMYWWPFLDGVTLPMNVNEAVAKGHFHRVPIMLGTTLDEGDAFLTLPFHLDGEPLTEGEFASAAGKFFGKRAQPLITQLLYSSRRFGMPAQAYSRMITDGIFACLTDDLANRASGQVPVYAYEFADRDAPFAFTDPFIDLGAFHLTDLTYLFQSTVTRFFLPTFTPEQQKLSNQMVRYWSRFAATGNPNGLMATDDPVWQRYDANTSPYLTLAPGAISTQQAGAYSRAHNCWAWPLLYRLK